MNCYVIRKQRDYTLRADLYKQNIRRFGLAGVYILLVSEARDPTGSIECTLYVTRYLSS